MNNNLSQENINVVSKIILHNISTMSGNYSRLISDRSEAVGGGDTVRPGGTCLHHKATSSVAHVVVVHSRKDCVALTKHRTSVRVPGLEAGGEQRRTSHGPRVEDLVVWLGDRCEPHTTRVSPETQREGGWRRERAQGCRPAINPSPACTRCAPRQAT